MKTPLKIKGCLTGVAVLFAALLFFGAFFTVDETQQAVILQLGKPIRVIVGDRTPEEMAELELWMAENAPGVALSSGAGLYFKVPFLQQTHIFDDRILEYDDDPSDVVTRDKKHLQVDCYARWRIQNPLLFLQSVQSVYAASSRLDDVIYSVLRQEIGRSDLIQIVRNTNNPIGIGEYVRLVDNVTYSDTTEGNIIMTDAGEIVEVIRMIRVPPDQGREALLQRVTDAARLMTLEYGIYVLDVRIKRADLPAANQQAVFTRMQAERNRISTRYRAEGNRMAQTILAETDLRVDSISALAERISLRIHGTADSTAAAIYAMSYEAYPDFYRFMQSLETLEEIMDSNDEVVLGTNGIFEYFASTPGHNALRELFLTGATGRLGRTVERVFEGSWVIHPYSRSRGGDLINVRPDTIIPDNADFVLNCAAVSSRGDCARDPLAAFKINSIWPQKLARFCGESGRRMVHLSTDLVYSGGIPPYTEKSPAVPRSLYGWTKLLGDIAVQKANSRAGIVRTSILVGDVGARMTTFSEDILSGTATQFHVDSFRNHTDIKAFARFLSEYIYSSRNGLTLAAAPYSMSRAAFAYKLLNRKINLVHAPWHIPHDLTLNPSEWIG